MSLAAASRRLSGISSRSYEHPADRAATAALRQVPCLDQVIRKLFAYGFERSYRQGLIANGIQLGPHQLPAIWEGHERCHEVLDLHTKAELYLLQTPEANAMVFGVEQPILILHSGLVALLDPEEITAVLAHEVGHIHSSHGLYGTVLRLLLSVGLQGLAIGELPLRALRLALLEWSRAAELSCDRAAALVLRDPLLVCRTLMKLAGGGVEGLNLEAFLQQASRYEDWQDPLDRGLRFFSEIDGSHPFAVRRVSELLRWVQSGEYDRICGGDYLRCGQEPAASVEFERAVAFYADHFSHLVGDAGLGLQQMAQGLGDWLQRRAG